MASSVATPLETQFAQIAGLSQMTSTSVLGTSQITLQFDLDRNIDAAAQDIQSAIDAAGGQLPKNLPAPPTYRKVNPADSPIVVLAVHSDVLPLTTVDDYCENVIAQQMSQIPGVAQVAIGGQQKPAVRVQVDPAKIAALGMQLEDVASVIATATVNAPKGSINGPLHSFAIYDNDQLLKAAPWNDIVIAYRNGAPVRIRDIGVAVDGPENKQTARLAERQIRHSAAGLQAAGRQRHRHRAAGAASCCPKMLLSVPPSIKVDQVANRTTTIKASVHDVEFTLVLTIALVVMVIFLFLRNVWATIIPGRHGAAVAAGHRGADVRGRLQPGQPVADGADDRGRLRGRRCHRDAGEHLPAHRGRPVAAGGDAQGLARDRLHDPVASASRWSRCSFRCC